MGQYRSIQAAGVDDQCHQRDPEIHADQCRTNTLAPIRQECIVYMHTSVGPRYLPTRASHRPPQSVTHCTSPCHRRLLEPWQWLLVRLSAPDCTGKESVHDGRVCFSGSQSAFPAMLQHTHRNLRPRLPARVLGLRVEKGRQLRDPRQGGGFSGLGKSVRYVIAAGDSRLLFLDARRWVCSVDANST